MYIKLEEAKDGLREVDFLAYGFSTYLFDALIYQFGNYGLYFLVMIQNVNELLSGIIVIISQLLYVFFTFLAGRILDRTHF